MPLYNIEFNKDNSVEHDIIRYDNEVHKGDFIQDDYGFDFIVLRVTHKPFGSSYVIASDDYEE